MNSKREYFPWIQVLRGVAAIGVVLFHTNALYLKHGTEPTLFGRLMGEHGMAGVDLFFVLSGFIMAVGVPATVSRIDFITARLVRIVPLYWVFTLVYLGLFFALPSLFAQFRPDVWHTFGSFFFLPIANVQGDISPIISYGWTLNYEMLFYVIFSLLIPFSGRLRLLGVAVLFLGLRVVWGVLPEDSMVSNALEFWSRPIVIEFLFGMLVALVYSASEKHRRISLVLLTAVASASFLIFLRVDGSDIRWLRYGLPALALVSLSLIVHTYRSPAPGTLIYLGDISYSTYLIQVFTIPVALKVLSTVGWLHSVNSTALATILVVGTCASAAVTYHLIERPPLRLVRKNRKS